MKQLKLPINLPRKHSLRPIHYLGSKLRILDQIEKVINDLDPNMNPICDLFAGSGSVSFRLSFSRQVIAADIQEYSRVICSGILSECEFSTTPEEFHDEIKKSTLLLSLLEAYKPLIDYENRCIKEMQSGNLERIADFLENCSVAAFRLGYFDSKYKELEIAIDKSLNNASFLDLQKRISLDNFGGLYFSFEQAATIDCILELISGMSQPARDCYLTPLLSAISEIVNTVGKQFAQPIQPRNKNGNPKRNLPNMVLRDRTLNLLSIFIDKLREYSLIQRPSNGHKVIRMDFAKLLDTLPSEVKIIYADPPYTRDHYSRYYHVLETLCLRDNPVISEYERNGEKAISRAIYRDDRHQSPFSIKNQAPIAFHTLFEKAYNHGASLVLSYSPYSADKDSRPRVMTVEKILAIANEYYKDIKVMPVENISHSKLNRADLNFEISNNAELIIVCQFP